VPDGGERRKAGINMHTLIVARLVDFYKTDEAGGVKVPKMLKTGSLTLSSLENRVGKIAKFFKLTTGAFYP